MPEKLTELPQQTRTGGGRSAKYEWDEWLAGGDAMLFKAGVDYTCKTASFVASARHHFDDEAHKVNSVTPPDAEKDDKGEPDRVALQVVPV